MRSRSLLIGREHGSVERQVRIREHERLEEYARRILYSRRPSHEQHMPENANGLTATPGKVQQFVYRYYVILNDHLCRLRKLMHA